MAYSFSSLILGIAYRATAASARPRKAGRKPSGARGCGCVSSKKGVAND